MKKLEYKNYTLLTSEIPNFSNTGLLENNKLYRGSSTINGEKWVRDGSSVEILTQWFKAKIDNLKRPMTFSEVCQVWGGDSKKVVYKDKAMYVYARLRSTDNRVVYLGRFYKLENYRNKEYTAESVHYEKVVQKFKRFVDEKCIDWKPCDLQQYNIDNKLYTISIEVDPVNGDYFGSCDIHQNSIFKCFSSSFREIEDKFKARLDQITHHKELAQGVTFEVEGIAGRKPFYHKGYTLWVHKSQNIYYGNCKHPEIQYGGSSSMYTSLVSDFKESVDTKVSESWSTYRGDSKEERIKELEKQLANLSVELEKVKNEKEVLVYKGVILEYGPDPAIRDGWMVGRIKDAPIEAETFYAMYPTNMKNYFETYIDDLEKSAKVYCQLMGLEFKESV